LVAKNSLDNQKQKTILIVEDEAILAMANSRIVKTFGYHSLIANSGELAVELALKNTSVDLILMDIDLGRGMDGPQAARSILAKRHLPVIFLTSHSEEEFVNKVKEITRYGYVIKGSNSFVLRESIQMAFELFDKYEDSQQSDIALKAISQGVIITDTDRKILSANDAFLAITGYEREEILGLKCNILQGELTDTNTIQTIKSALDHSMEYSGEILNYRKNGETFWNELTISPVHNDLGNLTNFIGVTRDITERKHMFDNLRLRENEVLFNNAFQFLPIALGVTTIEYGRFIAVNKAFEALYGYDEHELVGKTSLEIGIWVNPSDRNKVISLLDSSSSIKEFETQIRNSKGIVRWVSYSAEKFNMNGVACLLSGAIDITERKSQELEKEIERRVLEIVARGGVIKDILTKLVLCYEELFPGYIGSILLLDASGNHLTHGVAPNLPQTFSDAINGEKIGPGVGSCGTAAYTKQSTIVSDINTDPLWTNYKELALSHNIKSCWSVPIFGSNGQVLGTFAFYSNSIRLATKSELSAIERAAYLASIAIERNISSEILHESQNRFKILFEQAAVGVAELDSKTGKFIRINKKYCDILGYTQEEMLNLDFMTITHPSTLQADIGGMEQLVAGKIREYTIEKQYICKNGELRWVTLTVSAMWDPGHTPDYHIAIVQEITERKQDEEKIKSLLSEKEILLKEIHHRIKNNMSMVHSLLDLQASNLKEASAIAALVDASSRVQSMSLLYDKLYQSPNFQSMSTAEYLPDLIKEILANFPKSQEVKIIKEIDTFPLSAEKLQPLGIILNELLTNIMKYAFDNKKNAIINISIQLTDKTVSVKVSDNGIGISESVSFENSPGFGLTLVKMLTKQLYGKLNLSRKNGTNVSIEFPYQA
jgi:PAS domain S-box-containing protein